MHRPGGFQALTPVVKNLIIINILFFLGTLVAENQGINLSEYLGLHYFSSPLFKPYQLITYMFMHGGFSHIFFNMFALWMFGNVLENNWDSKRFFMYYFITGIGAGLVQWAVTYFQIMGLESQIGEAAKMVYNDGHNVLAKGMNYRDPAMANLNSLFNGATVGASGAVFGLLLAFGMIFPNVMLYVYFAIPIKAKWFVILYGAVELYSGIVNNEGDNVAHFAHLGGMLFGFILIKLWQKDNFTNFTNIS